MNALLWLIGLVRFRSGGAARVPREPDFWRLWLVGLVLFVVRWIETIAVAVLRPGEVHPDERTIANTPQAVRLLVNRCSTLPLVACYEAGPTG